MDTQRIYSYDENGNLECETVIILERSSLRCVLRGESNKTYVMIQCLDRVIKLDAERWMKFVQYLPAISSEFSSRYNTKDKTVQSMDM